MSNVHNFLGRGKNQIGEITIFDCDSMRTRILPFYACGHCSASVIMNPERMRERKTCKACGRWICDMHAICMKDCTPIYSLSDDHFENVGRWGELLPEILSGNVGDMTPKEY